MLPEFRSPRKMSLAFRALVLGLLAAGLIAMMISSRSHHDARAVFLADIDAVSVEAPPGPPPITQESIDLALAMYGIRVSQFASHPRLDAKLQERGLTVRRTFLDRAEVTVGPAAFTSWALLGSTLAHELEVHCEQNFFFIYLMDVVGLDGTGEAERQAYLHELRHAMRFGLHPIDLDLISDTMAYYYPETKGFGLAALSTNIRKWLAANVLRTPDQLR